MDHDYPSQIHLLENALGRIRATPPRLIVSPATQPRRASVAIIIHLVPAPGSRLVPSNPEEYVVPSTLEDFFGLDWVNERGCEAELVYIRRKTAPAQANANQPGPSTAASLFAPPEPKNQQHIAFPGGRSEPGDEGALYTAMRETWEELGIDLAERNWACVGQLDDREITTSLGKRLLMILSPFVFLHLTPYTPQPIPPSVGLSPTDSSDPVTPPPTLHSIPFSHLLSPNPTWSHITIDISSRLAPLPRHGIWGRVFGGSRGGGEQPSFVSSFWLTLVRTSMQFAVRTLVGDMKFSALVLRGRVLQYGHPDLYEEGSSDSEEDLWMKTPSGKYRKVVKRRKEGKSKEEERDQLKLWGLTLGMTLDLLSFMQPHLLQPGRTPHATTPSPSSFSATALRSRSSPALMRKSGSGDNHGRRKRSLSVSAAGVPISPAVLNVRESPEIDRVWTPSMASVFPRFSIPDVNFWIWVFGKRYRQVIRGWEASMSSGGSNDRRVNWSGQALSAFYTAVRKALVVVIVLRILGTLAGIGMGIWWMYRRYLTG